jgi:hypothetical protein
MTEFTKTKIHFALAFLGTLFVLHPFLQEVENAGFLYLGYHLKVMHAYLLLAGLLALCVYCFGLTLVSDRPHSWLEKLGNYLYGLAVMVFPFYGGLYLASLLADRLGQSHLAWAAPGAALALGAGWFILSQLIAWLFRGRLGKQDQSAKAEQLAKQEIASLEQAQELFAADHYDLSVMETWRALDARLRRALLSRGITAPEANPDALIRAAKRAGIFREPALALLQEVKQHWLVALSSVPITKEAATAAISGARHILATIPLQETKNGRNQQLVGKAA